MADYDFTLKFDTTAIGCEAESLMDRFYEAGCDDAIIGIGRPGRIALNFTRAAESALEAVSSALSDVNKVIPQAKLIEAAPDFVGLSDIADILGCSRQNIRNLYIKHQASFPSPFHESSASIWHLAKVLVWFREKQSYPIADSLLEISVTNMRINLDQQVKEAA